jgi:histidine ammonia-lyase
MWIMRLNVFARGNSGIRVQTVEDITKLIRSGILSEVPSRGSVGASGDLCPSAHAVLGYLGEGYCTYSDGKKILRAPAGDILKKNKIKALKLGPKEGLALINGTQLTTVLAAYALEELKFLLKIANLSCALMIEGLRGSHRILYQKVLDAKNQKGVLEVGKEMQKWLSGKSEIAKSHEKCGRVQDNYSLIRLPQFCKTML